MNFAFRGIGSFITNRISAVVGAIVAGFAVFACGAILTFFLAPRQALQVNRISKIPMMDTQKIKALAPGDDVLVSGTLQGSPPNLSVPDFIAYTSEKFQVSVSTDKDGKNFYSGSWQSEETNMPNLNLLVENTPLPILGSGSPTFSGNLHEKLVEGQGTLQADDQGQKRKDGSMRYRGFFTGDLVTVLGKKASVDGIIPQELFASDRVAFEEYQKSLASGFFYGGIGLMICSPIILIGGIISGLLFGKKE